MTILRQWFVTAIIDYPPVTPLALPVMLPAQVAVPVAQIVARVSGSGLLLERSVATPRPSASR